MTKTPGFRSVDKALKMVGAELKVALKQINQSASKLMSKGDYESAEELIRIGRTVSAFQQEHESLRSKWNLIFSGVNDQKDASERSAQWEFYSPILQVLNSMGGAGTLKEIESQIAPFLVLKPGDREPMSGGSERWKVMIRRARKHMVNEGLVEENSGTRWQLTKQGKRAAVDGTKLGTEVKD